MAAAKCGSSSKVTVPSTASPTTRLRSSPRATASTWRQCRNSGWPYIQHRGGPPGFLKVLDEKTLGFADFRGNLQYISVGNVAADDRAALILVDYPSRARLKILAHVEVRDIAGDTELAGRLALPGYKGKPERMFLLHLETFDWNCPQHITPRFTLAEIDTAVSSLRTRIAELEAENQALRVQKNAHAR